MGLFSAILLAPIAPIRVVVGLAEVIQRQVDQELNNPANTRKQLEALQDQRERGDISAADEKAAQEEIMKGQVSQAIAVTEETGEADD